MQNYKVILTQEAIYDITNIIDYIENTFGKKRADYFLTDIENEIAKLSYTGTIFPRIQIYYRNYHIYKKLFPPSIIIYILIEETKEVHVLRVLREERNWKHILNRTQAYTYPSSP